MPGHGAGVRAGEEPAGLHGRATWGHPCLRQLRQALNGVQPAPVQLLRTDRHSCVAHTLLLWCVAAQEEDSFLDNTMVLYVAVGLLAILAFVLLACSLLTKSNYPYIVFGAVFINVVTIIIGETRGGKLTRCEGIID